MTRKQDLHVRLVGQVDIARVERLPGDFCACIHARNRFDQR